MSIFDVLKRFRLPSFENDFIQDEFEKITEEATASSGRNVVHDPHKTPEVKEAKGRLQKWMEDEWERHGDPSDGASMSSLDVWED
jgi:hypothetical protein